MHKSITVTGFYGRHNTGDNILAATVGWGLAEYLAPLEITILSESQLILPSVPSIGVRSHRGGMSSKLAWVMGLGRRRIYVLGGGSVIHDERGLDAIRKRQLQARLARLRGSRTVAIGVSIGPIRNNDSRRHIIRFLSELSFISVRDRRSFELLTELGVTSRTKVHAGFDPAVLLPKCFPAPSLTEANRSGFRMVVSPCAVVKNGVRDATRERDYTRRLRSCLARVAQEDGVSIDLLVMNGDPSIGDSPICKKILRGLPSSCRLVPYDPDPRRAWAAINQADLVLGTRLHSLVLAYLAERSFLAMSYHPKVRDFVEHVRADVDCIVDPFGYDPQALADRILGVIKDDAKITPPGLDVEDAQAIAAGAFRSLAKSLA